MLELNSDSVLEVARTREVSRVLSLYSSEFTKHLATAISATEKIPEEINNHIRNAFTHLSRIPQCQDIRQVDSESEKAINHIERANRDCLKVAIICLREKLEDTIRSVRFYCGPLTPSIEARYRGLKELRRNAYVAETSGDNGQAEKLMLILELTDEIICEIEAHYNVIERQPRWYSRHFKQWYRPVFWVVGVVIGTVLGYLLKSYIDRLPEWIGVL